jgi:S1-C subfamily serine protease
LNIIGQWNVEFARSQEIIMIALALLLLVPGDVDVIDSKEFPKEAQVRALTATVRVVNSTADITGSGVILRRSGPVVYVLTAAHVVAGAKKLEVATFSTDSYPKAAIVYRSAEVIATSTDLDLAVLRWTTRDAMPGVMEICPASKVPEGKNFPALSVGCADGAAPTCVLEAVKAKRNVRKPGAEVAVPCWETAEAPVKGRSGGPLIDARCYLIGVDSGAGDGKGYYTHIEAILTFLKANGLKGLTEEKAEK